MELRLDLGQLKPVDRITLELRDGNMLPNTEIWLSEDGTTWWNVAPLNRASLQSGMEHDIGIGYLESLS